MGQVAAENAVDIRTNTIFFRQLDNLECFSLKKNQQPTNQSHLRKTQKTPNQQKVSFVFMLSMGHRKIAPVLFWKTPYGTIALVTEQLCPLPPALATVHSHHPSDVL